jgi:hypothetical protein
MKISSKKIVPFLALMISVVISVKASATAGYEIEHWRRDLMSMESVQKNQKLSRIGIDPVKIKALMNNGGPSRQKAFVMDTAVIYSYLTNPSRHIASFNNNGDRLSFLIQLQKNGIWENASLQTNLYDDLGNRLSSIWKNWENGTWAFYLKDTSEYDNGLLTSTIRQVWLNGSWVNLEKHSYTYDFSGNMLVFYRQTWSQDEWINDRHEMYNYDKNNNLTSVLTEIWDNNLWVNETRSTYLYDNKNNALQWTYELWSEQNWQNSYREEYSYNSKNNLTGYTGLFWSLGSWIPSEKYTYSYDINDWIVTGVGEQWNLGVWKNFEKGDFSYDFYGGLQTYLYQVWTNNKWENSSISNYDFDESGNAITGNYRTWNGETWVQVQDGVLEMCYDFGRNSDLFTGYEVRAHYGSVKIGFEEIGSTVSGITCFPNPVKTHLTVAVYSAKGNPLFISILDQFGTVRKNKSLAKLVDGINHYIIPVADLSPGVYFVKVETEGSVFVEKVILMR